MSRMWIKSVDDWQISADDLEVFRRANLYCVTREAKILAMFARFEDAQEYMNAMEDKSAANRATNS
jgi:hypothetical protein